ncbi:hypothetical protein [Serratia liquefaciens]|uniref:hypothetical protein n=1 Tax=Serratia liquefaciens TaxID=614 RepID=UPI00165D2DA2|nr:hypothetical protein [Serratia liquefaciens]QNQ52586.1 hypothetical protein IAI46_15155 [Serratia liquefaciens]
MKELDQFTTERLQAFIDKPLDNGFTRGEQMALARIAMAVKQAEPVAYMTYKGYLIHAADPKLSEYSDPEALYDAPPLNSPVIPDGWVLVPKELTERMVVCGFESEPYKYFSDKAEWKAYKEMSGCQQAAHRAKLCWDAMLAAAPKPEK